jgi:fucose permease
VKPTRKYLLLAIAFGGYILLGLPNGLLNVAWPSIRDTFGLSLDALGTLLAAASAGYILSSIISGSLVARLGTVPLLTSSSILIGAGALGYSVAPNWWTMVAFGLLLGLGNGFVDTGLNVFVANNYETRHMNWLHGFFGIGATLGPVIMAAILNADLSWRWGYRLVVALELIVIACFIITRKWWGSSAETASPEADARRPAVQARFLATLSLPVVWLGILLFMTHTGTELTAPQWAYTLFTEKRMVAPTVASVWTSIYWGSLTVSRLVLGGLSDRVGVDRMLRMCMVGIVVGAGLLWWNPTQLVSFLGLTAIGAGVALLFPSLISLTPRWVGPAHTANAIGFQVAAGSIGMSIVPGIAGILAQRMGLEVIGPILFVSGLLILLLFESLVRLSGRNDRNGRMEAAS